MMRKLLSVILSVLMLFSIVSTMSVSAEGNETEILGPGVGNDYNLPEVAEGFNRYFFYLPKSWQNEYTQTAGIYWFEGTGAHDSWPGVEANKADAEGVYYYDVPKDVDGIKWNNFFDGGNDRTTEEYYASKSTDIARMYSYEPGEHELYPDGIYDYNNMIFIVDFNRCGCLHWDYRTFGGDWYYYYGNGEYGTTPQRGEVVYTDRSIGEHCPHQEIVNPPSTLPEVSEGCNRYFFYMPDYWYNDYTDTAGIYWWEGTNAQASWPGLKAHKADAENVYYYDVPEDVSSMQWNNYVDLLLEEWESLHHLQIHTININSAYYESGESELYPEGLESFDGMIFVTSGLHVAGDWYPYSDMCVYGEWYYYYGNGEYGITPNRGDGDIYTNAVVPKEDSIMPPILGDADENDVVNVKDATLIQKFVASVEGIDVFELTADADGSEVINVRDATAIQKFVAGIDTGYKIGDYTWYKR